MVRGIERRRIFRDAQDREAFLERLGTVLCETGTPCLAWALMPNHVHLLVTTGKTPLAAVMQRLLTGYAGDFNRRYRRHGQLFQNRYKSILCEKEPYLLELVRYIHLNPLRGKLVQDLTELDKYPYAGHSVLLGHRHQVWQDTTFILGHFGQHVRAARRAYRAFVAAGKPESRRPELMGGGLIRSIGGWGEVRALRQSEVRMKGDERILGETSFVLEVLAAHEEALRRRRHTEADSQDLDALAQRAAAMCGVDVRSILAKSQQSAVVAARSLLAYWAIRELGVTATLLAKRLGLTQPAISIAARRGERIAQERGLVDV
jgi:REP element-mobilizing transposase RayT